MKTVRMVWKGKHSDALLDYDTHEIDIEGAIRAGKTTVCLWREWNATRKWPGIPILLTRWTDKGVYGLLRPLWLRICAETGTRLKWNAKEEYDQIVGTETRVYFRGLKTGDQTMRYSKFRGLTLARVYADQAEEIPHDVYLELAGRLSAPGFPHQITISPQSVHEDHWIAKEFPKDNSRPGRRYIALSVHDNAHNLAPEVIPNLVRLYPPAHPAHRTLLLGLRGMNVVGTPVYGQAFIRASHVGPVDYDPKLPIEMALDFGKHHPCVVFRQVSPFGQVRYLAGILGQDMYLDDFVQVVLLQRAEWFPHAQEFRECCDPAGAQDTSQGTVGAVERLKGFGIHPRFEPDSNSPAVRLQTVETIASHLRKRAANGAEGVIIADNPGRWLRVSADAIIPDPFLADAFEAGYVWDVHMVSVNNKPMRKPKKDGWYEHGMNCIEYLEINFGAKPPKDRKKERPRATVPGAIY